MFCWLLSVIATMEAVATVAIIEFVRQEQPSTMATDLLQ
jgi:ABC-type Co2+ transport system permease subunit